MLRILFKWRPNGVFFYLNAFNPSKTKARLACLKNLSLNMHLEILNLIIINNTL